MRAGFIDAEAQFNADFNADFNAESRADVDYCFLVALALLW
jgi:Mn-containing catalase